MDEISLIEYLINVSVDTSDEVRQFVREIIVAILEERKETLHHQNSLR